MTLHGASPATVRTAIETDTPLPGTAGFAGQIDGYLVRDVLGRELLFFEEDDRSVWARRPQALSQPVSLPPGRVESIASGSVIHTWELPGTQPGVDAETAAADLQTALADTLAAVPPAAPVAFSGGVDSGLLATATAGPLYVAGFPDSHDIVAARESASLLGRDLRTCKLTHDSVREAAITVSRVTGRVNPMDVAIAIPLYTVAQQVKDDGYDQLLLGQGADELFGGYAKVVDPDADDRVEATTIHEARDELVAGLPAQLERDILTIRAAGVEPIVPYLHDRVIDAAYALPESHLISDGRRKVALRAIAAERLPASIANRDKKALQYGTYVSRELDRLARRAGFKRRMDNHVSRYLESLVGNS